MDIYIQYICTTKTFALYRFLECFFTAGPMDSHRDPIINTHDNSPILLLVTSSVDNQMNGNSWHKPMGTVRVFMTGNYQMQYVLAGGFASGYQ